MGDILKHLQLNVKNCVYYIFISPIDEEKLFLINTQGVPYWVYSHLIPQDKAEIVILVEI